MNFKDVQLGLVRYRMDRLLITCNGVKEYLVQESNISNLIIQKDYDNAFFPLFTMSVAVPGWVARAMRKSSGEIKVYVDLKAGRYKNSALELSEKPIFTSYINGSFYGIIDDATPDSTEDIQNLVESQSKNKGEDYGDLQAVKILLYNETYLNGTRVINNAVLSGCTLLDAAVFVLNKSGIGNVLVDPPSNNSRYSQFFITPISTDEQLDRICNDYAMHSGGTVVFFDLDKVYLLNKVPGCYAYTPNEYKTVYLASFMKSGVDTTAASGCYTNSKEKYHLINISTAGMSSKSNTDLNDKLFGNNFKIIDSKTGNVTSASGGASKISGTTQYLISNGGGDTTNAVKQMLKESNKMVNIPFSYVDLSMLTPNKEFIISLDSATFSKYNGKVRLSGFTCIFEKEGSLYNPNVIATFKG